MAPKSKKPAEKAAAEEPAAKKAKADEEAKDEVKKEEEKVFQEPDAPKDTRAASKEDVTFLTEDTTLNVVPTMGGRMLASLTEGGMSYLVAGARGNVGLKAGRYMFEVKVVCSIMSAHAGNLRPKPMLRLGFSTASASLVVGDDAESVCFDGEGCFYADKKKEQNICQKYGKEHILTVILNLDAKSPNANTIAIYRDGESISPPKQLPDVLKGKPLFPHVAFRNVSVYVNFGPSPMVNLPFKCRMIQGAAAADVVVTPPRQSKDGTCELMLPVAFPDEGTFDWLDNFLEKNPGYTELSDRKIIDWARASGLWSKQNPKSSNDKPTYNFGIPSMDDLSVRRVVNTVAPLVPRNYVIMEVKANLLTEERKEVLKRFSYPGYKKVAHVVMGQPNQDFKKLIHDKLLKDKQGRSDAAWRARKDAEARAAARKAAPKTQIAPKKEKEEKDDEVKDEVKEEVKEEPDADVEIEQPPAVQLTEEEQATKFLTKRFSDLSMQVLTTSFGKFTTPEKSEGFEEIRYEWDQANKATEYLKTWILNKKRTMRVDDIQPGQAFSEKVDEFEKLLKTWRDALQAFLRKPKRALAKKKDDDDDDDVEIASVKNVCDAGGGVPLFERFAEEDWTLVRLRFELNTLLHAFVKDADDPDRTQIPFDHFLFYYNKYFGKTIDAKTYSKTEMKDIVPLVKDTMEIKDGMLCSRLGEVESLDKYLRLGEENRRERQRRIDAGDETARLKFPPPPRPAPKLVEPTGKGKVDMAKGAEGKGVKLGKPMPFGDKGDKGKGKVSTLAMFGKARDALGLVAEPIVADDAPAEPSFGGKGKFGKAFGGKVGEVEAFGGKMGKGESKGKTIKGAGFKDVGFKFREDLAKGGWGNEAQGQDDDGWSDAHPKVVAPRKVGPKVDGPWGPGAAEQDDGPWGPGAEAFFSSSAQGSDKWGPDTSRSNTWGPGADTTGQDQPDAWGPGADTRGGSEAWGQSSDKGGKGASESWGQGSSDGWGRGQGSNSSWGSGGDAGDNQSGGSWGSQGADKWGSQEDKWGSTPEKKWGNDGDNKWGNDGDGKWGGNKWGGSDDKWGSKDQNWGDDDSAKWGPEKFGASGGLRENPWEP